MSDGKSEASKGGIGFCGALFLLFLGLKLTGHITWSWFWVTAPLWGGVASVVAVLFIMALILGIAALIDMKAGRL